MIEEGAHNEIEIRTIRQLTQSVVQMMDSEIQIRGIINAKYEYEVQNDAINIK